MPNHKIKVAVIGSTGFVGLELVYLLSRHPKVRIEYLCSQSNTGKKINLFDKRIKKKLPLLVNEKKIKWNKVDVVFLSLPNGKAQNITKKLYSKFNHLKFIDLSADFRIKKPKIFKKWYLNEHKAKNLIKNSIYSIPEFTKKKVSQFRIISNPGCYATSIQLVLKPLLISGLIKKNSIIIDSKSGYSGAGKNFLKKFNSKNFFSSCASYSVNKHRHMAEIDQELKISNYSFNPHIIPTYRGIISSIYIDVKQNKIASKFFKVLKNFYKNKPFVQIKGFNKSLGTNDVLHTNKCQITINKSRNSKKIIIFSALDNLVKGAAGQAIQNMNLLFNLKENKGLR